MTLSKEEIAREITEKVLVGYLENVEEGLKEDAIGYFLEKPLPISVETRFGKVTVELSVADAASCFFEDTNARLENMTALFRDGGEVDIAFEEVGGVKAGTARLTQLALTYLLVVLREKVVSTMNMLFEESLLVSVMAGRASFTKDIAIKLERLPAQIDTRPLLNNLITKEANENRIRIGRTINDLNGLKSFNKSDWSQDKLRQAVIWAITKVPKNGNPTLARVAESISKRYLLEPAMKADALRMMLKRYELDWKELKKWEKGRK
jgi:hypothetical protein